ncbi:MAG: terminase large subunit, partial [Enterococcus sp.]
FIFCASNTKVVTNINGQKGPVKRKSPEHIDGFVSFVIGHLESMTLMDDIGDTEDYKNMLAKLYKLKKKV